VLLGQKAPGKVHGGPGNVRVDINAAGHHHHAGGVDGSTPRGNVGHDAAIGDADVANVAVDAVRWIVDGAAGYPEIHGTTTVVRSTFFISPTIRSCA